MDSKLGDFIEEAKIELRKRKTPTQYRPRYGKRPNRTKEEVAEYLSKHTIKTRRQLARFPDRAKPALYDVLKYYDTWKNAINEIYGYQPEECPSHPHLVIKAILEFDIKTYREYRFMAKANPHAFPNVYCVIKNGGWRRFKAAADRMSLKTEMTKCLKLAVKLKRDPKIKELKAIGVNMDRIVLSFPKYSVFIKLLRELRFSHEKQRGDRVKGERDDSPKASGEKEAIVEPFEF